MMIGYRIGIVLILLSISSVRAWSQIVLLAPDRVIAVSGSTITLDVRAEQIPLSRAASLVVEVSTPALLPPNPAGNTLSGLPPSVEVGEASTTMILRFSKATGNGLTDLKSRIALQIGPDAPAADIWVRELRYVPIDDTSVTSVPIHGVRLTINEPR